MTRDSSATPEIPSGPHPYVCPRCDRRTGVYDIATGVSECAQCGTRWRGPRVMLFNPSDLQTPEGIAEVVRQINAGLSRARDGNIERTEGGAS